MSKVEQRAKLALHLETDSIDDNLQARKNHAGEVLAGYTHE